MAATVISEQKVVGPYVKEGATQFTTLTMTESDPTNMNKVVMGGGRCLLIFQNTDSENAEWVTIESSPDAFGRTADIVEQDIVASGWGAFIIDAHGWEQTLGGRDIVIDTESTDVDVLAIPI